MDGRTCTPTERRLTPASAKARKRLVSTEVGLASMVISMLAAALRPTAASTTAATVCGCASEGVPPPRKMLWMRAGRRAACRLRAMPRRRARRHRLWSTLPVSSVLLKSQYVHSAEQNGQCTLHRERREGRESGRGEGRKKWGEGEQFWGWARGSAGQRSAHHRGQDPRYRRGHPGAGRAPGRADRPLRPAPSPTRQWQTIASRAAGEALFWLVQPARLDGARRAACHRAAALTRWSAGAAVVGGDSAWRIAASKPKPGPQPPQRGEVFCFAG